MDQGDHADTLDKLKQLRHFALQDPTKFNDVFPQATMTAGPMSPLVLRRWGAEFIAESLTNPTWPMEMKSLLGRELLLPILQYYVNEPKQDTSVLKSAVQIATSFYPIIFLHSIMNPAYPTSWEHMTRCKRTILDRLDHWPADVQLCGIKFMQQIVRLQTYGLIHDKNHIERNDLSLALVSASGHYMRSGQLAQEADIVLDRLLRVFDNDPSKPPSNPLFVIATLNCLLPMAETRPQVTSKILNVVLKFDPFKILAFRSPLTPSLRIQIKSMIRTSRAFLLQMHKRDPNRQQSPLIHEKLQYLSTVNVDTQEAARKRPAEQPMEPDASKRPKVEGSPIDAQNKVPAAAQSQTLPPTLFSNLFAVSPSQSVFHDVTDIPQSILPNILTGILPLIDGQKLQTGTLMVGSRLEAYRRQAPKIPADAGLQKTVRDRWGKPIGKTKAQESSSDEELLLLLKGAQSQQPSARDPTELRSHGRRILNRLAAKMAQLSKPSGVADPLSTSLNFHFSQPINQNALVTLLSRISSRYDLKPGDQNLKAGAKTEYSASDEIRGKLFEYILQGFRSHTDLAITWLSDEWANERARTRSGLQGPSNYNKWTLKLLDSMALFLTNKDMKLLVRFLSEIPEVTDPMLARLEMMARDPEQIQLVSMAFKYLCMFRKPVREKCLDIVEGLCNTNDSFKTMTGPMLKKWRPGPTAEG